MTRTMYFHIPGTLVEANDPTEIIQTAFAWACAHDQVHVVELLLKSPRIDPTKKSTNDTTPFALACYRGRDEVVKLLLKDPRVDVNEPNQLGQTPLFLSCHMGHINVTFLLVSETRVDVTRVSSDAGVPPIYNAAVNGHQNLLGLLLTSDRIDPNQPNGSGATSLFSAAYFGHLACVQRILACGRSIDTRRGSQGYTPVTVALIATTRAKDRAESDEGFQRAKRNSKEIADLITNFERNPGGVIAYLRTIREWLPLLAAGEVKHNDLTFLLCCSPSTNPRSLCDHQCPWSNCASFCPKSSSCDSPCCNPTCCHSPCCHSSSSRPW